jgi:hypothetical protein
MHRHGKQEQQPYGFCHAIFPRLCKSEGSRDQKPLHGFRDHALIVIGRTFFRANRLFLQADSGNPGHNQ